MARFTRIQVALKMAESGMIPVFFHKDVEVCKQVITACYKGGIRLFEFTNRGEYAHVIFEQINKFAAAEYPDMIVGTGSVIDAPTAVLYVQLGSNFIVSPILNEEMADVLNRRKILWSPGCGSASEISRAESLGAEIVKIFPGSQVGGPKFIAAVKGPMPWTSKSYRMVQGRCCLLWHGIAAYQIRAHKSQRFQEDRRGNTQCS
jgi:2-dehydro-3-deoxyphosphogluconate aldolase/(4S)-4-hydroxy-2-oxoglutarate aldolase